MGITGLVLLIACSNRANLPLGDTARATKSASAWRSAGAAHRPPVADRRTSLSALGTVVALPATRGAHWLVGWASTAGDWRLSLELEWRHVAFTAAIAVISTCLFGLAPAWTAIQVDVQSALQASQRGRSGGRFRNRLGKFLVVAQISVSLTMLSGAVLLRISLWNLRHQDFGFDAERVLLADLPLEFTKGHDEAAPHCASRSMTA